MPRTTDQHGRSGDQHGHGKSSEKGVSMGDVNKAINTRLKTVYERLDAIEESLKPSPSDGEGQPSTPPPVIEPL